MTITLRSAREFGRAVRDHRRARALTQDELAARSGVGRRFIAELEAGKATTQLGKALTVAHEVGLVLVDAGHGITTRAAGPVSDPESDPLVDLPRF